MTQSYFKSPDYITLNVCDTRDRDLWLQKKLNATRNHQVKKLPEFVDSLDNMNGDRIHNRNEYARRYDCRCRHDCRAHSSLHHGRPRMHGRHHAPETSTLHGRCSTCPYRVKCPPEQTDTSAYAHHAKPWEPEFCWRLPSRPYAPTVLLYQNCPFYILLHSVLDTSCWNIPPQVSSLDEYFCLVRRIGPWLSYLYER